MTAIHDPRPRVRSLARAVLAGSILIAGPALLSGCDAGGGEPADAPTTQSAGTETDTDVRTVATTHRYHVEGMSCGGCATTLQGLLAGIDGVERCSVSYEDASAEVVSAEPIEEAIRAALEGYQFELSPVEG